MKIEIIDNDLDINDIESGTLVQFCDKVGLSISTYGILLKDIDGKNPIIYDLESDKYYTDVDMYTIKVAQNREVKLVVE